MKVVSGLPGVPQHNLGMVGCLKCGITCHSQKWLCHPRIRPQKSGWAQLFKAQFFEKSKSWKPCPNLRLLQMARSLNCRSQTRKTFQNRCQVRSHCQRLMALKSRRMPHGQASSHWSFALVYLKKFGSFPRNFEGIQGHENDSSD